MSNTNVGKAEDILVNAGFIRRGKELKKDNIVDASVKLKPRELEIVAKIDENNKFMLLNNAGNLLKDSWLTRSTGHKIYDFKSLQAASSLNYTGLNMKLKSEARKQRIISTKDRANLSDKQKVAVEKAILPESKKLMKQLYKVYRLGCRYSGSKQELDEFSRMGSSEKIKKVNEYIKNLADKGLLPKEIKELRDDYLDSNAESLFLISLQAEALPLSIGLGSVLASSIIVVIEGALGVVSAAMLGAGVPLIVATILIGAALFVKKESLAYIIDKREKVNLQKEVEKALHYLDAYLDKLELEIRRVTNDSNDEANFEFTKEMKKDIAGFLNKQKNLWDRYTSAAKREYLDTNKVAQNLVETKHWTGFRKTSNEKTHKIGKLKELLANIWVMIADGCAQTLESSGS